MAVDVLAFPKFPAGGFMMGGDTTPDRLAELVARIEAEPYSSFALSCVEEEHKLTATLLLRSVNGTTVNSMTIRAQADEFDTLVERLSEQLDDAAELHKLRPVTVKDGQRRAAKQLEGLARSGGQVGLRVQTNGGYLSASHWPGSGEWHEQRGTRDDGLAATLARLI
jgi:hypothetical protein